ncbi:ATRX chromatin remodeler XNP [Haematobia irritans]|uniref:ATRX chromatin remodeler XNP n=1 Tax=Haematobia irritans TaxID=7368 RepID=UPI003F50139B
MGKGKTGTELKTQNAQNRSKKTLKDKKNSIDSEKSEANSATNVRKAITEVLEDENTNGSNTSTNSRSNKSSSPSTTSSSTSSSKEDSNENDLKENSSSKENREKSEEKSPTEFRVAPASNNSTGFKLRIVPLEKLLERPPTEGSPDPKPAAVATSGRQTRVKKEENNTEENNRRLPERRSKPVSFIELSDSGEEEIVLSSSSESNKNKKTNKKTVTTKGKTANKASSSDSEDDQPIRKLKSPKRKQLLNSEGDSDSDEDEHKEGPKKSSSTKKSSEKVADTEEKISKKISTKKNESEVARSKSASEEDKKAKQSKNSKRKRFEKSSDSGEDTSIKGRAKRKVVEKSTVVLSDSEEEEKDKKKSKDKSDSEDEFVLKQNVSRNKTPGKSSERDKSKSIKKPSVTGPPPSPSAIRRCTVRLKRCKLSDFKDLGKNKTKRKMNGGGRFEKPTTSSARRRQITSDDDSDVSYKRSANIDERLADHDYDGLDIGDDEENEDDNASQNSSDSEIIPTRKKRVFNKKKDDDSNNSDSDFETNAKGKKKKRRIRRNSSGDSDDEDKKKIKRKDIRKIIKSDDLNVSTKEAAKEEEERRKRIEERQKIYNKIYEKPESAEVTELVLDFDEESKKTILEVDKGLVKKLKPHQVTGVKFMWDACFETVNDAQEKPGSGCILAHCMGLGKTMQIVTLSHTLLANSTKTGVERVLIISPLSTLNNWAREFKHWMGFTKKRNIEIYDMSKYKDKPTRIFKLNEWFEEGGVCILGYDMYRILSNEKAKGLRKKQREQVMQSLVDPGPDLVVCDEGHLLKNEKTSISKAVTRMRTKRRIVLTGTPLQNNLKEYYCMIQFIKPNLLGTYKEYLNRFVNPISNGQYTDSTDRDIRLMKHRSHILHKLLEGCIQRRDYSVLAPYLPPKHEYVVYTTLSTLQQSLYEHYMVHQRDQSVNSEAKGAKLFQDFQELRRIWTHPMNMRINSDSVIRKKVLADENDSIDDFICDDENDEEEAASTSDSSDVDSSKSFGSADGGGKGGAKRVAKTRSNRRNNTGQDDSDIEEVEPAPPQDDPSEWWKRFVADKELNNINHSPKLVILMRLLEQCEAIGDKLLVFSQSLQSLDTIEHFLSLIDSKTRGYEYEGDVGEFRGFWTPNTDYFRLDGSCSVENRESMCKKFNDVTNLRSRLFLISTRAGGLGINLVSANRVVIFDVSWNPSHDTQSIFRVYRFGQDKPCYIYRLIAMGTMEQKLYERQVAKQATAKRVIDEQQISRHYNQSDLLELYTYELTPSTPREIPILPKDRLFAELLTEHESLLFKYHEHDSLLENEESENLSAEERKAAWSEYEAEKTRTIQTAQYMSYDRTAYGQFGNSSGSVTSNKIFGFRSDVLLQLLNLKIAKDHPEMTQNQVIQVVPTYLNVLYNQMNNGDPTMYKDLLALHATLVHPSGMYMNPLLYVNQNPSAAGYYQAGAPPNGMMGAPMMGAPTASMAPPRMAPPAAIGVQPGAAGGGFDPDQVYEID